MNNLNSILIEGTLATPPHIALTPNGTPVGSFVISSTRSYRQDDHIHDEVSYFDIECTGRLAERCADELSEGRTVRVVGRLHENRWRTHEGKARSHVRIIAEHIEFLPNRKGNNA